MLKCLAIFAACLTVSVLGDCPALRKVKHEVLGGNHVSQTWVQLELAAGKCVWVIQGGTAVKYRTENCGYCKKSARGVYCVGSGVMAAEAPCQAVLGPDCQWHIVDGADKTKPCKPMELPAPADAH